MAQASGRTVFSALTICIFCSCILPQIGRDKMNVRPAAATESPGTVCGCPTSSIGVNPRLCKIICTPTHDQSNGLNYKRQGLLTEPTRSPRLPVPLTHLRRHILSYSVCQPHQPANMKVRTVQHRWAVCNVILSTSGSCYSVQGW